MRICIIGPVTPFRSGIARHTTAIARELARREKIDVSVMSFSRQYPRFLYPGDDDHDPEAQPPDGIDIDFCLDSINPLSWLAAVRRVRRRCFATGMPRPLSRTLTPPSASSDSSIRVP